MAQEITLSGQNSYLLKTIPSGGEQVNVNINPLQSNGVLYPIIFIEVDRQNTTQYNLLLPDLSQLNGNYNVKLVVSNSSGTQVGFTSHQSINSYSAGFQLAISPLKSIRLTGNTEFSYSLVPIE